MPNSLSDYLNYQIPREVIFSFCVAIAVILKLSSAEFLRLMLLRYLKLEKNQKIFIVTLFCSTAPSCIMAPFYVFDHDRCIQKNFMIDL